MPKRNIGISFFGILYIVWGVLVFILEIGAVLRLKALKQFLEFVAFNSPEFISFFTGSFIVSFIIFSGLVFAITGLGILRLRAWAWYLVVAEQFLAVIGLPTVGFYFGWQMFKPASILLRIAYSIFVLWFFLRPHIKGQFILPGQRFRMKSVYGVIIILSLICTLTVPLIAVGWKINSCLRFKEPFFSKQPSVIELANAEEKDLPGYKRIEVFNMSFAVPEASNLINLDPAAGSCWIYDADIPKSFFMLVDKKSGLGQWGAGTAKMLKFRNIFDFEKAIYSANWGLILLVHKYLSPSKNVKIFKKDDIKGLIKYGPFGEAIRYDISIYNRSGESAGNILLSDRNKKKIADLEDVLKIIKSLRLIQKQEPESYYNLGLRLLEKQDVMNAKFAFANAYYLLPEKTEYSFMFAKTLATNRDNSMSLYNSKNILEKILKSEPDYPGAKELFDSISRKLEELSASRSTLSK